jgi:mono/diheme cytochrome c family protein
MRPSTIKIVLLLSLLAVVLLLITCAQNGSKPMTQEEMIKRGSYLVNTGSCNDCHSPKKYGPTGPAPDQSILLSGHPANLPVAAIPAGLPDPKGWVVLGNSDFTAWAGPWGVSFAANLTPDAKTGIGAWTEDDFVNAMRKGKHMGTGRDILPPMPWQLIGQMTDEDLKSMFAYLKSLPAVPNLVPGPIPPQPAPAPQN